MTEVDRARRARERGDGRTWRERALAAEAEKDVLREAIAEAEYALHPNEGERSDVVRASMWLRTTFPPNHPNYVPRADLERAE